jgi:hypothetical protein
MSLLRLGRVILPRLTPRPLGGETLHLSHASSPDNEAEGIVFLVSDRVEASTQRRGQHYGD